MGHFLGGMYDGMDIVAKLDCKLTRESTNPCEPIRKLFNQVISGFDGLAAAGAAVCLTTVVVGAGAGLESLVSGWITVMSQFIFTTANLCMMGDLGWQDLGCLQHTSRSLFCEVEHQRCLATK